MRLVIERGELLRALGHVTSVVERRTTIPILSNVLLRARDSTLEFKATDLEREVIEGVAADVQQPGAVTVPAHMLHDIVRKLPDGSQVDIRRDAEKERLTLAAGHARFAFRWPQTGHANAAAGAASTNSTAARRRRKVTVFPRSDRLGRHGSRPLRSNHTHGGGPCRSPVHPDS